MEKIDDIIKHISHDKGIEPKEVEEAIKKALIRTAQTYISNKLAYDANISNNGELKLLHVVKVVSDDSELLDDEDEKENVVSISEAKKEIEDVKLDEELKYELDFETDRSIINSLYKNLEFEIQILVKDHMFNKYMSKRNSIISGPVVMVDNEENTFVEIDEVRAILPKKNRIKGESFKVGSTIKAVVKDIRMDKINGIRVEISRTTPKFLEALLTQSVPEIEDGKIVINASARIPGERAKVALSTMRSDIDPVGATIGARGVRINAVSEELNGENIDCIEYSEKEEIYVARALSPALIKHVEIDGDVAKVKISQDQKSKCIGARGMNIRLASFITGKEIELIDVESAFDTQAGQIGVDGMVTEQESKSVNDLEALFKK